MARTNQKSGKQPRRSRSAAGTAITKHPVIDNRKYPSTEEVGRILKVPAGRIRQLKELAIAELKGD